MTTSGKDLGTVLHEAYVSAADLYTTALTQAGEVAAACRRGEAIDDRLSQVLALLAEIAKRDAMLVQAKQRWEQAGRPKNDSLRNVMDRIAVLIRQIQSELQIIEESVQARRDQLAGELDVCNRRCRMQRAYQGKS
jgi:hypothetical protein